MTSQVHLFECAEMLHRVSVRVCIVLVEEHAADDADRLGRIECRRPYIIDCADLDFLSQWKCVTTMPQSQLSVRKKEVEQLLVLQAQCVNSCFQPLYIACYFLAAQMVVDYRIHGGGCS